MPMERVVGSASTVATTGLRNSSYCRRTAVDHVILIPQAACCTPETAEPASRVERTDASGLGLSPDFCLLGDPLAAELFGTDVGSKCHREQ